MKKRVLSKTLVKEILNESAFEPKERTPFKIVISMENPGYCELKAVELINEAQMASNAEQSEDYHNKITQAIALLALARFYRGANGAVRSKNNKTGRAGSQDQSGLPGDANS